MPAAELLMNNNDDDDDDDDAGISVDSVDFYTDISTWASNDLTLHWCLPCTVHCASGFGRLEVHSTEYNLFYAWICSVV